MLLEVQVLVPVYPRVCGGTFWPPAPHGDKVGLSPRVRGNHLQSQTVHVAGRSIPACAGEPRGRGARATLRMVYPRVCGGTGTIRRNTSRSLGLSPRVRGNLLCSQNSTASFSVYPRVCGGTWRGCLMRMSWCGLSPRVRGNPTYTAGGETRYRSIPACAGEPQSHRSGGTTYWVYPRVCGGTRLARRTARLGAGLSPRVRGNHRATRPGV